MPKYKSPSPHPHLPQYYIKLTTQHSSVGSPRFSFSTTSPNSRAAPFLTKQMHPLYTGDYCDVYLTHDSMSVRKAHNSGRNHERNVLDYYQSTVVIPSLCPNGKKIKEIRRRIILADMCVGVKMQKLATRRRSQLLILLRILMLQRVSRIAIRC